MNLPSHPLAMPLGGLLAGVLLSALAACGGGADGGDSGFGLSGGGGRPRASGGGETPTENPSTGNPAPASSSTSGPSDLPPPPTSGAGSAGSQGMQFFSTQVYAKVNAECGSCHVSGAAGAPKFFGADAPTTYQSFDVNGYIAQNSRILAKGPHAGGAAAALTADTTAKFNEWLVIEASERGGATPATSIWTKIQNCATAADWEPVNTAVRNLRTIRRNGENANNCTGCNQAQCETCHHIGEYGFWANNNRLTAATAAFAEHATDALFWQQYLGTNGTQLVVSPKIKAKADAVATGRPYSHPLFQYAPAVQTAVEAFANGVITKYNAKQCGQ